MTHSTRMPHSNNCNQFERMHLYLGRLYASLMYSGGMYSIEIDTMKATTFNMFRLDHPILLFITSSRTAYVRTYNSLRIHTFEIPQEMVGDAAPEGDVGPSTSTAQQPAQPVTAAAPVPENSIANKELTAKNAELEQRVDEQEKRIEDLERKYKQLLLMIGRLKTDTTQSCTRLHYFDFPL